MLRYLMLLALLACSLAAYPQSAAELAEMAEKKLEKDDYQYALVLIEKAIAKNDSNQWYYLTKADIERKLYGSRQALKTVFKAISINRKNPEPYSRAGTLYASRNMADSAIYMFDLAVKRAPDDTTKNMYLMNRGAAKQMIRDFEGARADYEQIIRFDPDNIPTLNNLSAVYAELDMKPQAIRHLKRISDLSPGFNGPLVNLGFIYSDMDSLDLALQYFDKALAMDPKDPLIYNNMGYVYYKKGSYATALKQINHSISLLPSNSYAYRNLALVYIATGKKTEACDALRYARSYDFKANYGDEVDELIKTHCR